MITMRVEDGISPVLENLVKKTRDLSPAMKKIELLVMQPLKKKAWRWSGITSQSGELESSVQTWHGKKSTGFSVKTSPGRDLVIPKAITLARGRKRGSTSKKKRYTVRGYTRRGKPVSEYTREKSTVPWGDIQARPFVPSRLSPMATHQVAVIIEDYFEDVQDV